MTVIFASRLDLDFDQRASLGMSNLRHNFLTKRSAIDHHFFAALFANEFVMERVGIMPRASKTSRNIVDCEIRAIIVVGLHRRAYVYFWVAMLVASPT
jgi:hypothetical protein